MLFKMKLPILVFLLFTIRAYPAKQIWTDGRQKSTNIPIVRLPDFSKLAASLQDTVVNIYTTQIRTSKNFDDSKFQDFFQYFLEGPETKKPSPKEGQSLGTGFIINRDGYILTNYHVVKNAQIIRVKAAGSRASSEGYPAELIGRDPELDIALLKIDVVKPVRYAVLGNSSETKIGQWVIAIGNPFGLGHTVTKGIVTAKHRILGAGSYENYIQTDASINPGNSGGPLFNMKGEVIGINTIILAGAQGTGFAIPINMVKDFLPQLLRFGEVKRGYIGIATTELTEAIKRDLNISYKVTGAYVARIEKNTPASEAGLRKGDIIVKFNGRKIVNPDRFSRIVAKTKVGSQVPIEILRQGKTIKLSIKLIARPIDEALLGKETLSGRADEKESNRKRVEKLRQETTQILGMKIVNNTMAFKQKYSLPKADGVLVVSLVKNGLAHRAGLEPGDIIDSIDGKNINSVEEFISFLNNRELKTVILRIHRGVGFLYITIKVLK